MTIPDPITLIVALLLDDTAVSDIADTRVFAGGLPQDKEIRAAMPQATVVVSPSGGPGRKGRVRYRRNRVDTCCYGATLHEAWTLHLAVREALEMALRDEALFSAETTSDGANAVDPTTQWPTCYASYSVLSADEA